MSPPGHLHSILLICTPARYNRHGISIFTASSIKQAMIYHKSSERMWKSAIHKQKDTTVVNLVTPMMGVVRFISTLWKFYDLHDIQKTSKEALLERKYFTGSMPLLTPNHGYKTCGCPEAFTSTTICKKCGVKLALEGRNTTSWKHIRSELPYHKIPLY